MSKKSKKAKKRAAARVVPENWKVVTVGGKSYLLETMHNTEIAVAVEGREDILKSIARAANEGWKRASEEGELRRQLTKEITSRYVHLREAFGKVRKQAREIAEAFEFAEGCLERRERDDR